MKICEACAEPIEDGRAKNIRFCKRDECLRARQRARWDKYRRKAIEEGTFRGKINDYQRKYRAKTLYGKSYQLSTKYGLTLDDWEAMLEQAGHKCEICGRSEPEVKLCVDHDHATNQVRGVLCRACNRSIGQLGDSAEALLRAAQYLQKAEKR